MTRPFVDETLRANDGVLGHLRVRNERGLPLCALPDEVGLDPYLSLGSHPDVVVYIWKTLASKLPEHVACIVLGTPALADPVTGIVLSVALGTTYALWLEPGSHQQASAAGLHPTHEYAASRLDAAQVFGTDWLFGVFHRCEPEWLERSLWYPRTLDADGLA